MNNEEIVFDKVSFSYGDQADPVLQRCSFTITGGDRFALEGESGSGKTTFFRLLLGFETPNSGNIYYQGDLLDQETSSRIRHQSAWLPQDLDLGSGTVETLINFPFRFEQNKAHQPTKDTVIETMNRLGLEESLLKKNFSDLSTGQRQRIGIVICYLLEKPLILLDEPTAALDLASKEKAVKLLLDDSARTLISSSHDPWWLSQCNNRYKLGA